MVAGGATHERDGVSHKQKNSFLPRIRQSPLATPVQMNTPEKQGQCLAAFVIIFTSDSLARKQKLSWKWTHNLVEDNILI